MSASQNVAFEPSFDRVLAEHFHDATIRGKLPAIGVFGEVFAKPNFFADFVDSLELVRLGLVWPEDSEILHVLPRHFSEKIAERGDAAGQGRAGFFDFNSGIAEVRHL